MIRKCLDFTPVVALALLTVTSSPGIFAEHLNCSEVLSQVSALRQSIQSLIVNINDTDCKIAEFNETVSELELEAVNSSGSEKELLLLQAGKVMRNVVTLQLQRQRLTSLLESHEEKLVVMVGCAGECEKTTTTTSTAPSTQGVHQPRCAACGLFGTCMAASPADCVCHGDKRKTPCVTFVFGFCCL